MLVGRCKLCLEVAELRNSHFLPASLYRKSRTPGEKNPNPILVTRDVSVATSEQVTDFVLCSECEKRLDVNGERYVMSQVNDGRAFPLLDALTAISPVRLGPGGGGRPEFLCYKQSTTPFIKRDHLAYFGLSVFWRASAHKWRGITPIDLGKYEEVLRTYLLGGAPFPANIAVQLIVCTDNASQATFFPPAPSLRTRESFRAYSFQARGIVFILNVGKLLPNPLRDLCFMTGPQKWIVACDWEPKTIEAFRELGLGDRPLKLGH